jgi:hypothetical protein
MILFAQNDEIVDWMTKMVQYHKVKTEEKKINDAILKVLHAYMFPDQQKAKNKEIVKSL